MSYELSKPLIMQQNQDDKHDSSFLPEVVPIEALKSNTIRHDETWYLNPHTVYSPLSNSPYTSSPSQQTYVQAPIDDHSLRVQSFEKTSRKKFALLCVLVTFLATALVFSIALGIPLALSRNKLDPNNYAVLPALQVDTLKKNGFCDNNGDLVGGSVFTTRDGSASFDIECGVIFQEGLPAYDPAANSKTPSGTVRNIAALVTYTVSDCLEACASLNNLTIDKVTDSPKCQSVTFITKLQGAVEGYGGNCFLKNSTLQDLGQAAVSKDAAVSAEVHRLRN